LLFLVYELGLGLGLGGEKGYEYFLLTLLGLTNLSVRLIDLLAAVLLSPLFSLLLLTDKMN
jgi:expansin (peptidoglycan-binding protein)